MENNIKTSTSNSINILKMIFYIELYIKIRNSNKNSNSINILENSNNIYCDDTGL